MLSINYKNVYETEEKDVKEWVLILYDISANHYVGVPVFSDSKEGAIFLKSINKYVDPSGISDYNRSKMKKCIYIKGKPIKISNNDFNLVLSACRNYNRIFK